MHDASTARPLFVLAYHLERQALDAYRLEHSTHETIGDALAIHSNGWKTEIQRLPGGNSSVTVMVDCKHKHDCTAYWFALQKRTKGWVVRDDINLK